MASNEQIVSLHFPKAGGSSLRIQPQNLLGDDVALDYSHDPLTTAGAETANFPHGKRVVHGHFRAKRYAAGAEAAYWMTFLRDPVDNLISIYFFWKGHQEPTHAVHARLLRECPSILEFARYPVFSKLMSETYFGGFDMRRFNLIGLHENRDLDIRRLAAEIGLPLVAEVHENKSSQSSERNEVETNISVQRRLTDLLFADVKFYGRIRRVVIHQAAAAGFSREDVTA